MPIKVDGTGKQTYEPEGEWYDAVWLLIIQWGLPAEDNARIWKAANHAVKADRDLRDKQVASENPPVGIHICGRDSFACELCKPVATATGDGNFLSHLGKPGKVSQSVKERGEESQ